MKCGTLNLHVKIIEQLTHEVVRSLLDNCIKDKIYKFSGGDTGSSLIDEISPMKNEIQDL